MTRVLVVSRNAALAVGLAAADYDVIDLRPDGQRLWLSEVSNSTIAVLDLDDPVEALTGVDGVRGMRSDVHVVLVSSGHPGWESIRSAGLDGIDVLPLPTTLDDLLACVRGTASAALRTARSEASTQPVRPDLPESVVPAPRAAAYATAAPVEAPAAPVAPPDPPVVQPTPPLATAPPLPLETPPAPSRVEPPASAGRRSAFFVRGRAKPAPIVAPADPMDRVDTVDSVDSVDTVDSVDAVDSVDPVSGADTVDSVAPLFTQPRPPATGDERRSMVRHLLSEASHLAPLAEIADRAAGEVARSCEADAAALLLPDGAVWRVAGGFGLRPIERRLQLGPEAWLVQEVCVAWHGLVIEDSDIARHSLAGAPLASRRHLLAVPVALVDGVLLLAREEASFTTRHLKHAADMIARHASEFDDAMAVRALARTLDWHRDLPD